MKFRLLIAISLIIILAACSKTSNTSYYYTANEEGSISIINSTNNKVVDTIKLDGTVHNVQVSPDGKWLGATLIPQMEGNDDHHEMKMNGFAIFYDTKTNEFVQSVEVGNHPAHLVFTDDNKYALVTNNEDNNVFVIDTRTFEVVHIIPTGSSPHGFRISKDSKYAYVANMGEDTVSVLDLTTMTESKKIKVGKTPVTTGVSSDGNRLVVTLNAENSVAIVDLSTEQVERVPVGTGPAQVYISPDDRYAYVANQGTENSPSHTLSKIEIATKKVVATIETGNGAHGVTTSSDGKSVFVTNMFDNTVSVIDSEQNKVISTIKVGQTPNGISFK